MPAWFISMASLRISKKQQIANRRANVLELYSQGLSQQKISEELKVDSLKISQQTISLDIKWLKEHAIMAVNQTKEDRAFEWQQVLSNLYQLREKAWNLMKKAEKEDDPDDELKKAMFPIIQSINADIMHHRAIGLIISADLLRQSKESASEIQQQMEKMEKALEQNQLRSSSALF
jgi:DNA-binding transcriptional regulator LsrR (DeoR family)